MGLTDLNPMIARLPNMYGSKISQVTMNPIHSYL